MVIVNWAFFVLLSLFVCVVVYIGRQAFRRYAPFDKTDIIFIVFALAVVGCLMTMAYGLNDFYWGGKVCITQ